jgi:hypothetical protein
MVKFRQDGKIGNVHCSSEWFVVLFAVCEYKDLDIHTCSFMCCSYGREVWTVISSEDIGCQVQMTGPKREFVTEGLRTWQMMSFLTYAIYHV